MAAPDRVFRPFPSSPRLKKSGQIKNYGRTFVPARFFFAPQGKSGRARSPHQVSREGKNIASGSPPKIAIWLGGSPSPSPSAKKSDKKAITFSRLGEPPAPWNAKSQGKFFFFFCPPRRSSGELWAEALQKWSQAPLPPPRPASPRPGFFFFWGAGGRLGLF